MRWHVVHSRPGTVQEALNIATEVGSFSSVGAPKKSRKLSFRVCCFKPCGCKARDSIESTLIDILQEIKRDREEQKQLQEFVRRMTDFSGSDRRSASHSTDGSRENRCWNCGELGHVSRE